MTNSITFPLIAFDAKVLTLIEDHRYTEAWFALADLNPDVDRPALIDAFGRILDLAPNPL